MRKKIIIIVFIALLLSAIVLGTYVSRRRSEFESIVWEIKRNIHKPEPAVVQERNAGEYVELALYALDRGDTESAISYCQQALELEPDHPEAFFTIGIANVTKRNYDIAIVNLKKSL